METFFMFISIQMVSQPKRTDYMDKFRKNWDGGQK